MGDEASHNINLPASLYILHAFLNQLSRKYIKEWGTTWWEQYNTTELKTCKSWNLTMQIIQTSLILSS